MNEKFLSFVWLSKLFERNIEIDSEKLEVISPGELNNDSGPDFINSRVKINNTLWAGNVEIHVLSSDWYTHNHHKNAAFDNVILHVVWKNDKEVYTSKGRKVPAMELKFHSSIWQKYENLIHNSAWIPCAKELPYAESIIVTSWMSALAAERLECKISAMINDLQGTNNDWEEIFYRQLIRSFGFHVNSDAFLLLAKSISFKLLEKHSDNLLQIEALLFGQAGFLQDDYSEDEYFLHLKKEYEFLKFKYNLKPIDIHIWKFMRLRPANFPTIRIAQFAGIFFKNRNLLVKIVKAVSVNDLQKLFNCGVSEYWETHYHFGGASKEHKALIGIESINTLVINTIIPFYFLYGKRIADLSLCNKALAFLENLPPEKNSQLKMWAASGIIAKNAFDTQALLFLKKEYCDKKRCLECRIGAKFLRK